MIPTNFLIRMKARKALRGNLSIVLVIALIASLPSLIASTVVMLTGSDMQSYFLTLAMDGGSVANTGTVEQLMEEVSAFAAQKGWIGTAANMVAGLIAPVLELGLMYSILTMLRGGVPEVKMTFSRLGSFVKSVLLILLILLKLLLWALPGLAVIILGSVLLVTSGASSAMLVMFVGSIAASVLIVRAAYSYSMANLILADQPETGVVECVRRSKAMMQGRRGQLFLLEMNYLLWQMLASMVSGMFGGVIGTTLGMALQLVVMVYMTTARCTFYEAYSTVNNA